MKVVAGMSLGLALTAPMFSHAQDSLTGKYSGSYTTVRPYVIGVSLVIASVEDGIVKGTASLYDGRCMGEYPVEGTYKDNKLVVRATAKGGKAGDCSFGFAGTVEGNSLNGKMGQIDIQLRK